MVQGVGVTVPCGAAGRGFVHPAKRGRAAEMGKVPAAGSGAGWAQRRRGEGSRTWPPPLLVGTVLRSRAMLWGQCEEV